MHTFRQINLLVFCILLSLINAFSQHIEQDLYKEFYNLNETDGLSDNAVLDIVQDQKGFMWIATRNGLNRFDGNEFVQFYHNENDINSVSNNYITSLSIDANGSLWVGTKNGLNKYLDDFKFEHFPMQNKSGKGLQHEYVRDILVDDYGTLWIETRDGTLTKYNIDTKEIQHYKHQAISQELYDYHSIVRIGDTVMLGGRDMGPYIFDVEQEKFQLIKSDAKDPKKKRDQDVACIYPDSKNRMWISATDGFYQYFPEKNEFEKLLGISCYDIIENTKGDLLLATGAGLYIYDPDEALFSKVVHNPYDEYTIISDKLLCFYTDTFDNIWIGTRNGISVMKFTQSVYTHYRHIPENTESLALSEITDFEVVDSSVVWISSMDQGLTKWNVNDNSFTNFNTEKSGLPSNRISCLYADSDNTLWIGYWAGIGFSELDQESNSLANYSLLNGSAKADWYVDFYEDANGRFMAGFWGARGIHFFNRQKKEFEPYHLMTEIAPNKRAISRMTLIKGKDGDADKIITMFNGVQISFYDTKDGSFTALNKSHILFPDWENEANVKVKSPLQWHFPTDLLAYDESVFISTEEGIVSYNLANDRWQYLVKSNSNIHKLCMNKKKGVLLYADEAGIYEYCISTNSTRLVIPFERDKPARITDIKICNEELWISSNNGLFIYDTDGYAVLDASNTWVKSISSTVITGIVFMNNHQVQLSTSKGFYLIDRVTDSVRYFNSTSHIEKGLLSDHITDFVALDNDKYFVGTDVGAVIFNTTNEDFIPINGLEKLHVYRFVKSDSLVYIATNRGLFQYDIPNSKLTDLSYYDEFTLSSHLSSFIRADAGGNIWHGTTNNGVNFIHKNDYKITQFTSDLTDSTAFWGNSANAFCLRANGDVLISGQGLNIYDSAAKTFFHITEDNGLPNNNVLAMVEDDDGYIWMTTSNSLIKADLDNGIYTDVSTLLNLNSRKFTAALNFIHDDILLVGTENGYYKVNINEVLHGSEAKIQFTSFSVFGDKKMLNIDDQIINLNHNENFFSIGFSTMDLSNNNHQLTYQLLGVDKQAVNAISQNKASYTQIREGTYTFIVNRNNDAGDTVDTKSLTIKINPPWYRTLWFRMVFMGSIISLISYLFWQRIRRLKAIQDSLIMEQKLLRAQLNPHFLFNTLIAIQSFLFTHKITEAGRYLSKFAKLMRQFLNNSREEYVSLEDEINTLQNYLELQKLRFDNSFDYEIQLDENIEREFLKIPPMMVQPIIENSIEHGFNSIDYKGRLILIYALKGKDMEIRVLDNGIGVRASQIKTDRNEHKSMAIEIIRQRLKLFNKKNKKHNYNLHILDIANEIDQYKQGFKQGTMVRIFVPVKYV